MSGVGECHVSAGLLHLWTTPPIKGAFSDSRRERRFWSYLGARSLSVSNMWGILGVQDMFNDETSAYALTLGRGTLLNFPVNRNLIFDTAVDWRLLGTDLSPSNWPGIPAWPWRR